MTVLYNVPLNISALTNQLFICCQLKKYREKSFNISQTTYLFRKILMLQQKYPRIIVECPMRNLKHLGSCAVLLSQCHSQFIKQFKLGFFSSMTCYEFETCVRGNNYQIKLTDSTIKQVSLFDF